ncbi:MAG: hypothetical protein JXX28_08105 [Deltaproteobacteria bacterium]|nr:hypothetical protein [Deltaproteobacteria bacterium]
MVRCPALVGLFALSLGGCAALLTTSPEPVIPAYEVRVHNERLVRDGWIIAGAPSSGRLREVVGEGAVVISHSGPNMLGYDEDTLVRELGGAFSRTVYDEQELRDPVRRAEAYAPYREALSHEGPVYIHCNTGNKAGALWALFAWEVLGEPPHRALRMGLDAGLTAYRPTVEAVLGL